MELLGDVGHVESCFGPSRDGVRVDECTIILEIILNEADGTPR
jgi:hypothetical protein